MAATALHRFGYGPRPGEIEAVSRDPMGWVLAQIEPASAQRPEVLDLPASEDLAAEEITLRADDPTTLLPRSYTTGALDDLRQHVIPSLNGPSPFTERMVRFWSEFFLVPCATVADIRLALSFEREVIRPHLYGTLSRLLTRAIQHPAVLIRFDHLDSIGAFSDAGVSSVPNPQSALPRHILTHWVPGEPRAEAPGVAPPPSPDDIRALTEMMTGWTVGRAGDPNPGQFLFRESWHQPDVKQFLGRTYPEAGQLEAEAAMDSLARQEPAVRYIADRMARYVLGRAPRSGVISDMVRRFARGGNSLSEMTRALVEDSASWSNELGPVKTPTELALATGRALDLEEESADLVLGAIQSMGQMPYITQTFETWRAPPESWIAPEPFLERLEWAGAMGQWGGRWPQGVAASDIALDLLGARLDPTAHRRLMATGNRGEGLALTFATPGFQRR